MASRYLLLGGDDYYPSGGLYDFLQSYESIEDACKAGAPFDWWHVFDCDTRQVVAKSKYQGYGTDDSDPPLYNPQQATAGGEGW